jgi:hypothetical protein
MASASCTMRANRPVRCGPLEADILARCVGYRLRSRQPRTWRLLVEEMQGNSISLERSLSILSNLSTRFAVSARKVSPGGRPRRSPWLAAAAPPASRRSGHKILGAFEKRQSAS